MLPSGAAIPTEVGSCSSTEAFSAWVATPVPVASAGRRTTTCEPVVSTIPRSSGTRGSASTSPLVRLAALPKTS
jgi:hypothetical protein